MNHHTSNDHAPQSPSGRQAIGALFALMRAQHGVASSRQARSIGLSRVVERRLLREGSLTWILPGVLATGGLPTLRSSTLRAATLLPGVIAISHGAAARLHGIPAFARHRPVDVIGDRGTRLTWTAPVVTHYSRGPIADHLVTIDGVAVTSLALTLIHLAPELGVRRLTDAVTHALRGGYPVSRLRTAALAWRRCGRAGPQLLLSALERAATVGARDSAPWPGLRAG